MIRRGFHLSKETISIFNHFIKVAFQAFVGVHYQTKAQQKYEYTVCEFCMYRWNQLYHDQSKHRTH